MTADKDSLLDAVFSAVTLPPVTTNSKSVEHSEYHQTIETSHTTTTQSHFESHQVHSVSSFQAESHNGKTQVHHDSFHATDEEVALVKQKLAELAHHDEEDHQEKHSKRDSVASTQSSVAAAQRFDRAHSTASSHATSLTSEGTLDKIHSALAERESLNMGTGYSKGDSIVDKTESNHHSDHSRTASIVSKQSEKSTQSVHSAHSKRSDDSESTLTGGDHGYHNAPQILAAHLVEPDPLYDMVPEITEEIVLEDSHGRILSRDEEFPDYPPPPPPQQQALAQEAPRSPVTTDLLSDLRNHRIYQQNMPDDETSTTISEARVESILGKPTNGHKEDSDSDDEDSTIVVLRSIVKRDFDSSQIIAVENPAIKRTASQVKPLDQKLKTELQAAMQTRAIEDDSSSSTLSHEEIASQKNSITAGVDVHRDASIEEHGHKESVVRHEDHETEQHATVEPSHVVHLTETTQNDKRSESNSNPPEPDHWEPRRFTGSSQGSHGSQGFEHPVYREHHGDANDADHSDDEGTLTSHDGINPIKTPNEYHIEPLVTSLRKEPDDYPTYLHRGSVSSKASSMVSEEPYRPPVGGGAYLHRDSNGGQEMRLGSGSLSSSKHSHPNQPPHLDPIPPGGFTYHRDTSVSQASLADSEHSSAYQSRGTNRPPPPTSQPPVYPTTVQQHQPMPSAYPRPRGLSRDNYSTVSSVALIPNLYDQPKVTEKLRPVRAQDVLKTLEKEKPVEYHYDEPVYDEVYDDFGSQHGHHHHHHEQEHHAQHVIHHDHHELQQPIVAGNNVIHPVRETPVYARSVNSDGYVHVPKPPRQSRYEHHLPYGDHFVLTEGVNTLRGRWERGTFRNHEETESERNYAINHLNKAIGSTTASTVETKSRSATASTQASQSTVTSKRSQPKSEISTSTVTESVASKRSKQSIPQLHRNVPKSRTSTLQHIDENEELHVPRTLSELRVDVGPPSGPILPQAPVTSPAYNEKFQSLRVVKSVRQFVQQWSQPDQQNNGKLIVYKHPQVHAVQPPQVPQHYVQTEPVAAPRHPQLQNDSRRNSVQSNATSVSSVSARSSVSQQSARQAHKASISQQSQHSQPRGGSKVGGSKQPSLIGSLPRGLQSNGTTTRSGSELIHEQITNNKRASVQSHATTLTQQSVAQQQHHEHTNGHDEHQHHQHQHENHPEQPMSPAFEEHPVTEVKIRAETHVLTELVPVAERRALFESNDHNDIRRNYSINRRNVVHDHLPPMVNVLE